MNRSLSVEELERAGFNCYLYSDLKGKKIKDLVLPTIVLYLNNRNYGHYCCLLRSPKGMEFFDSYAYKPDDQFRQFSKQKLNYSGAPYMSKILASYPGSVEFNEVQLQEDDSDIATCGRHCALRIKYADLTHDEYIRFINGCCGRLKINPDELSVLMTKKMFK